MSVLNEICRMRREDVAMQRRRVGLAELREAPAYQAPTRSLSAALRGAAGELRVIAEHKRASPSTGAYGVEAAPVEIARDYVAAGAAALSVLTEERHFGGSLAHLRDIRAAVDVPLLRKDFVVDAYQLHEAKAAGADAVLLIAAALTLDEAQELRTTAHHLGLEVFLELHAPAELDYLAVAPDVVGVNSRDLATLRIDLATAEAMADALPRGLVCVAESGIRDAGDAARMARAGYDGLLIGTQFMRQPQPGEALARFRRELAALTESVAS